ncbi:LLM class flavin-dependent oxidoreductase [Leptolyngbya cf. ectocarpi LEGE 11479]|uniref:LLM class flavin-dependent oxidoreductase n=1 Tax=Leptolyngbya cf. ectocarpi LEGE 11479 TaxID=1828722 RepID=A0A928ZX58_LEPEC|nr:LLM class flavin-dependent oxidoreductase [Leptolyngbya ectocarpi]MBE9069030.1 LLM class flavin-dependent oxidoreductase [Leptolyngbya cf. ectocarpi LEGE 11479]
MTKQETARVLTTRSRSLAGYPDMDGWCRFARQAEDVGIESVLLSFGNYEPDTLMIACALGLATQKLKFIVAYRLGLMQPTTFVQQVNSISTLIEGRIALNIIAGSSPSEQRGYGDFLDHDQRYARAKEFLAICHAFWQRNVAVNVKGNFYDIEDGKLNTPFLAPDRSAPEIYVAGHSQQAIDLACTQGSCWLRVIDTPENLKSMAEQVGQERTDICLRLCVVCRPTRKEAIAAAEALRSEDAIVKQVRDCLAHGDSQMFKDSLAASEQSDWLNQYLWTGLVSSYGASAMTLVGTPEDLVEAFLEYKSLGVTQFILAGWPKLDEMLIFGHEVLPLIRQAEQQQEVQLV